MHHIEIVYTLHFKVLGREYYEMKMTPLYSHINVRAQAAVPSVTLHCQKHAERHSRNTVYTAHIVTELAEQ